MKLSDGLISVDRMEQGGWVDDIPGMDGFRVKTRGDQNADYRKKMNVLIRMLPPKKRIGGQIDPVEQQRIIGLCILETCLLDWDGLFEEDGTTPVPYSKEFAKKLMLEPSYQNFRNAFVYAASVVAEQTMEEQKEVAGN